MNKKKINLAYLPLLHNELVTYDRYLVLVKVLLWQYVLLYLIHFTRNLPNIIIKIYCNAIAIFA